MGDLFPAAVLSRSVFSFTVSSVFSANIQPPLCRLSFVADTSRSRPSVEWEAWRQQMRLSATVGGLVALASMFSIWQSLWRLHTHHQQTGSVTDWIGGAHLLEPFRISTHVQHVIYVSWWGPTAKPWKVFLFFFFKADSNNKTRKSAADGEWWHYITTFILKVKNLNFNLKTQKNLLKLEHKVRILTYWGTLALKCHFWSKKKKIKVKIVLSIIVVTCNNVLITNN